jgi:hypothetical protein
MLSRNDGLSPSTNIAAASLEEQRETNRLNQDKLDLDRLALEIAGKVANTQRTYAISAVIAAIAAVIAAIAGIANLIILSIK